MATVKICDHCGVQQDKMPFTVTEKNGDVSEVCSATCYLGRTKWLNEMSGSA